MVALILQSPGVSAIAAPLSLFTAVTGDASFCGGSGGFNGGDGGIRCLKDKQRYLDGKVALIILLSLSV